MKYLLVTGPKNHFEKFNVETGDGTMGSAKIRTGNGCSIHPLASAKERGPLGKVLIKTNQKDLCLSCMVSRLLGHGESGASFRQTQQAGPRLREAV